MADWYQDKYSPMSPNYDPYAYKRDQENAKKQAELDAINVAEEKKKAQAKTRDEDLAWQKSQRDADLAEGAKRGQERFGEGSLGRVNEGRSDEMKDIIARRQALLNGYTPQEMGAMRDQFNSSLDTNTQTNLRQLRGQLNRNGVQGAAATATQARMLTAADQQRNQNEQQIFLKNIDEKRNALSGYETSVGGAEKDELGRQQYNIGQGNNEKYGQLATEYGYASLGANDRAAILQKLLGQDQADATKAAADSGGKK